MRPTKLSRGAPPRDEEHFVSRLFSGTDARTSRGAKGLDGYGCATFPPQRMLELGSCTASTVSPRGFEAAWECSALLEQQGAEALAEVIRLRLATWLGLPASIDIVLTSSGTDAELIALLLTSTRAGRAIRTLMPGEDERGAGSLLAASGRHFSSCTPLGGTVQQGEPLVGLAELGQVKALPIRGNDAQPLSSLVMEQLLHREIEQALTDGVVPVLHRVACSKTGLHAPDAATMAAVRHRWGDRLLTVVDACQGRFAPASIQAALTQGSLVLITGSKFFGGPSFCGAVLVPPEYRSITTSLRAGSALDGYLTQPTVPSTWRSLRRQLPTAGSEGLLLRWTAALEEVERVNQLPEAMLTQAITGAVTALQRSLGSQPGVRSLPLAAAPSAHPLELTTILGFELQVAGQRLSLEQLRRVGTSLHAEGEFHLGQPTRLPGNRAVLRLALGAPLVSDLVMGGVPGATLAQRLEWLSSETNRLLHRLNALAAEV